MRISEVTFNPVYSGFFKAENRHAILYGGRGSGKSVAAAQKNIMRAVQSGERILTVRKVLKTCRHSTFQLYKQIIERAGIPVKTNRTEMSFAFPSSGGEIHHAGLDDFQKLLSYTDPTTIWIEEADQLSEDDFEEVDVLMRGQPATYFQTVFTFNPRKGKFFVRRRFIDNPASEAFVLRTTWRDNRFLDADYGRRLGSIADANKRAIYEAGEWGEDVRGLIYRSYVVMDAPDAPPDSYGLDFGFVHPLVLTAFWDRDPVAHVRQVIYASGMMTPVLLETLAEEGVDRNIPMYCDHNPGIIAELVQAGYDARPAVKDVNDGIATVQRFQIAFTPDSPDLQTEADEYRWAENKDGIPLNPARPVKLNDDGMDSMRYAIHSHVGITEPSWGMW